MIPYDFLPHWGCAYCEKKSLDYPMQACECGSLVFRMHNVSLLEWASSEVNKSGLRDETQDV